jgi:four helix bundle protein
VGHDSCIRQHVGAHSFHELDAWQLSNDLKLGVYELLRDPDVQRDVEFRGQIQNAAASAPRNIAEGFGRYLPREFSQYLRIANGSLMETSNHLRDGCDRGYFTADEIEPLLRLARRASAAVTRLIRYLQTAPSNPRTRTSNPRTKEPKNRNPST